jgi:hypothetical protein
MIISGRLGTAGYVARLQSREIYIPQVLAGKPEWERPLAIRVYRR